MFELIETYLTEKDLMARVDRLASAGLTFVPMTRDELILSERLCRKGVLERCGSAVRRALPAFA